jgi:hypothetical protein
MYTVAPAADVSAVQHSGGLEGKQGHRGNVDLSPGRRLRHGAFARNSSVICRRFYCKVLAMCGQGVCSGSIYGAIGRRDGMTVRLFVSERVVLCCVTPVRVCPTEAAVPGALCPTVSLRSHKFLMGERPVLPYY